MGVCGVRCVGVRCGGEVCVRCGVRCGGEVWG